MMPLHPSFRRLVLEHIPKLKREDLDDYDSLIALRLELVHRRSHVVGPKPIGQTNPEGQGPKDGSGKPRNGDNHNVSRRTRRRPNGEEPRQGTPREELDDLIDETTRRANAIIAPYRAQFDALHKLWAARRNFALHQGGLLQIPASREKWRSFFGALGQYLRVQVQTFPVLVNGHLKRPEYWGRLAAIVVMVSMILYGLSSFEKDRNGKDPQPPRAPDSTAVQQ